MGPIATSSSNSLLLSPQRQAFTYDQHDARLPPDLLPYGPQALSFQNSSTAILDHKKRQYQTTFDNVGNSVSIAIGDIENSVSITTHANGSTQDLRIYHPCNGSLTTGTSITSPKSLVSLSSIPLTRTNYEYSTSSSQNSSKMSLSGQQNHQQQLPYQSIQSTNSTKLIDNGCKPRQSIVRTSPSFSFLSTGYQQQDNFL